MPLVDTLEAAKDKVTNAYQSVLDWGREVGVELKTAQTVAMSHGWLHAHLITWIGEVLAWIFSLGSSLVGILVDGIRKGVDDAGDRVADLAAQQLGELTGADADSSHFTPGGGADAVRQRFSELGGLLTEMLETDLAGDGSATPEQGARGAATLTGLGINIAVKNSLMNLLGELASAGFISGMAEFGDGLARNLGMGRLVHRGLGPLIDATVAQPYKRYLFAKYPTTQLSPREIIRAFNAGRLSEADARQLLGEHGYTDEYAAELLQQLEPNLAFNDLGRLIRWGKMTREDALQQLQAAGWTAETAAMKLDSDLLALSDEQVRAMITVIESRATGGYISTDDAAALLQALPLTDDDVHSIMARIGLQLEYPRAALSLAELQSAYADGIITLSDVQDYLLRKGYSPDDAYTLLLITAAKQAAASARAQKEKLLSFAQLGKLYKAGLITQAQLIQYLGVIGYDTSEVALLGDLLTGSGAVAQAGRRGGQPAASAAELQTAAAQLTQTLQPPTTAG